MQFIDAALAAVAVLGAGSLLDRSPPAPEPVEVVYSFAADSFGCTGCKALVVDRLVSGGSFVCPGGDIWTLTISTPVMKSARCEPLDTECVKEGACMIKQLGTVILDPQGGGACPLSYSIGNPKPWPGGPWPITADTAIQVESSVQCRPGVPSAVDCEDWEVVIYDSVGLPAIKWSTQHCCSRCPI